VIYVGNKSKRITEKDLILQIEDEIIVKFCELNGGMEFAMPIVRKQYEKHNIDFKNPSRVDLYKIVETLIEVTKTLKGKDVARNERKFFKELLNKLEKEIQDLTQ
jgi:hypothetical protein